MILCQKLILRSSKSASLAVLLLFCQRFVGVPKNSSTQKTLLGKNTQIYIYFAARLFIYPNAYHVKFLHYAPTPLEDSFYVLKSNNLDF